MKRDFYFFKIIIMRDRNIYTGTSIPEHGEWMAQRPGRNYEEATVWIIDETAWDTQSLVDDGFRRTQISSQADEWLKQDDRSIFERLKNGENVFTWSIDELHVLLNVPRVSVHPRTFSTHGPEKKYAEVLGLISPLYVEISEEWLVIINWQVTASFWDITNWTYNY